jgi:hypothetical protein
MFRLQLRLSSAMLQINSSPLPFSLPTLAVSQTQFQAAAAPDLNSHTTRYFLPHAPPEDEEISRQFPLINIFLSLTNSSHPQLPVPQDLTHPISPRPRNHSASHVSKSATCNKLFGQGALHHVWFSILLTSVKAEPLSHWLIPKCCAT